MIGPKIPKLTARQEREAYDAATERDNDTCVRCGHQGRNERDHRQNRDAFNTTPANLQLLCGPFANGCHKWKTENPAEALRMGFAVPSYARPEVWPGWRVGVGWVQYFDGPDIGGRWWQPISGYAASLLMQGGR